MSGPCCGFGCDWQGFQVFEGDVWCLLVGPVQSLLFPTFAGEYESNAQGKGRPDYWRCRRCGV